MFWALFLLFRAIFSCPKGCLQCLDQNTCNFCDTTLGFSNQDGQCIESSTSNCALIAQSGACLRCSKDFYFTQGLCAPVRTKIDNCLEYYSAGTCEVCEAGFYLKSGLCAPAEVLIDGCVRQDYTGALCAACGAGRVLSLDNLTCKKIDQPANCGSASYISCEECESGYFLTPNNYLLTLLEADVTQLETYFLRAANSTGSLFYPTCAKVIATNCARLQDPRVCLECAEGFYLSEEGLCLENPDEPISFCRDYASLTQCSRCQDQYYLSSDPGDQCLPHTTIQNCRVYSQTVKNICEVCLGGFYSLGDRCAARVASASVSGCAVMTPNADTCASCTAGMALDTAGLSCLPGVANCATHATSGGRATCLVCSAGYYKLDDTRCTQGTMANCAEYASGSTCSTCIEGFFVRGGTCAVHPNATALACAKLSPTVMNSCVACGPTSTRAAAAGLCMPVQTVVQNCVEYSDKRTCRRCNPMFSYLEEGVCVFGTIDKCVEYDSFSNICLRCMTDYSEGVNYVVYPVGKADNSCVPGNQLAMAGCLNLTSSLDIELCVQCAAKTYPRPVPFVPAAYCLPDNFYLIPPLLDTTFCLAADPMAGKCVLCQPGLVVGTSGACVAACRTGEALVTMDLTSSVNGAWVQGSMVCVNPSPTISTLNFDSSFLPCYRVDKPIGSALQLCAACAGGQIGLLDFSKNDGLFLNVAVLPNSSIDSSPLNRISPVSACLTRTASTSGATTSASTLVATLGGAPANFDNCRYALRLPVSGAHVCGACRHGYSGEIALDDGGVGKGIFACKQIESCEAGTFFSGLATSATGGPPLDLLVSCHRCHGDLIPTYGRLSQAAGGGTTFQAPLLLPPSGGGTPKLVSQTSCGIAGLGLGGLSNCGTQEVDPGRPLAASSSPSPNPICTACAPGFTPSGGGSGRSVGACVLIPQCNVALSRTFNRCDLCNPKYGLKYDAGAADGMSYGRECVAVANQDINCLVYDSTAKACVLCKRSFLLNQDGVCDPVPDRHCLDPGIYTSLGSSAAASLAPRGSGCQRCEGGFIGIRGLNFTACFNSTKLLNSDAYSSRFLVANCASHGLDALGALICRSCRVGYIPAAAGAQCLARSEALKDCAEARADGIGCAKCSPGFFVVAAVGGTGGCRLGSIQDCLVYSAEKVCETCSAGFVPLKIRDGAVVCFRAPLMNCLVFRLTDLMQGVFTCQRCSPHSIFSTDLADVGILPLGFCLAIPPVAHCEAYDSTDATISTLSCIRCGSGYVLNGNECRRREESADPLCLEPNPSAEGCARCVTGNFPSSNDARCRPPPSGVPGCVAYSAATVCIRCRAEFFLAGPRECRSIPAESLITGCAEHSAPGSCTRCRAGFFYAGPASCEIALASGCATYSNAKTCASCLDFYVLVPAEDAASCKPVTLANCQTLQRLNATHFECQLCQTNFFLQAGACVAVPNAIPGCEAYAAATRCGRCFGGRVLSFDQTRCLSSQFYLSRADPHCNNNMVVSTARCNSCQPGFAFNSTGTECVRCTEGAGCLACDLRDPKVCLLCSPGYTMDETFGCKPTRPQTTDQTPTTDVAIFPISLVFWVSLVLLVSG